MVLLLESPTHTSSLFVRSRLRMSSSRSLTFSISCLSFFALIMSDHTVGVSLPPLHWQITANTAVMA